MKAKALIVAETLFENCFWYFGDDHLLKKHPIEENIMLQPNKSFHTRDQSRDLKV